jgi:hopene-associated glycosyltransferase HpnB
LLAVENLVTIACTYMAVVSALLWLCILLLPSRPWGTREALDAKSGASNEDLTDVTVIIPARNEAEVISQTLGALSNQGNGLKTIVVDDQSTDDTALAVREAKNRNQIVIAGQVLPNGWSGKLWALEQGRQHSTTALTLLLDADVELRPDIVRAAREKLRSEQLDLVSLLATPRMQGFWEQLLMPAFVYFFKLLYPFQLCASPRSRVAAAAGGFVLVKTEILGQIGGFSAIKKELIDDCALARRIKAGGGATWLGLSHDVESLRQNRKFMDVWNMVTRTAFTQLNYSTGWLALCTLVMLVAFCIPELALINTSIPIKITAITTRVIMVLTYVPILKFYGRSPAWAVTLPLVALLYLAMTWGSAAAYWRGRRACWKDRVYRGDPA